MATFRKKLEGLLAEAEERRLIDPATSAALLELASGRERKGGLISLAGALGWLGAAALGLGVILLISANWRHIPDPVKIAAFLLLFASVHAAGLAIRWRGLPYRKTAEAFHFLGGILFIAGIGLISQIYHLNGAPANAVMFWIAAVAPLAFLLTSPGLSVLSLFAIVLWFHLQGSTGEPPLKIIDSFSAHLAIEVGLGTAGLGLSARVRRAEPVVAAALAFCGAALLFGALYLLGFYRHFGSEFWNDEMNGQIWLPGAALLLGAIGLAVGAKDFALDSPSIRPRLMGLLAAVLLFAALVLGVESEGIPSGPALEFFNFGWTETFSTAEWVLSFVAWALWFLLALACVAYGSTSGRSAYLNLGVAGVGLGIVTRFFDLVGGLAQTGFLFVAGGAVLLVTAYATERWRKRLTKDMRERPA